MFNQRIQKFIDTRKLLSPHDKILVALSGGADSVALLRVLHALDYSCDSSKDEILASDMAITAHDINVASQGRIGLIIVPQASKEVVEQADKYEMAVITTGFTNITY